MTKHTCYPSTSGRQEAKRRNHQTWKENYWRCRTHAWQGNFWRSRILGTCRNYHRRRGKNRQHNGKTKALYKKKIEEVGKDGFQKILDHMSYIGLLEYDYGYHYDHNGRTAPQSERRYILPMFVPGSAELFNMEEIPGSTDNPRLKEHPAVASFFERITNQLISNIFLIGSKNTKDISV